MMTSTEVAQEAGVSRAQVNVWVRRGDLAPDPVATLRDPATGRVTKYLFDPKAVKKFLTTGRAQAKERTRRKRNHALEARRAEALEILAANGNNYRQAARTIGVTPKTISQWARDAGLPPRPRGNPRRPKAAKP